MEVWSPEAYLSPAASYGFGSSVALDQDVLAVGDAAQTSPADGSSRSQAGVVYVFSRATGDAGSTWTQSAYPSAASGPAGNRGQALENDRFGSTTVLSNGTLAVGTPGGGGYVFLEPSWAAQAYVLGADTGVDASILSSSSGFGDAIALDGDELVIGAPGAGPYRQEGPFLVASGAAAVFSRAAGAWTAQTLLPSPSPAPSGTFAGAVAISRHTIAVADSADASGAIGIDGDAEDQSSPGSGAVWIFQ